MDIESSQSINSSNTSSKKFYSLKNIFSNISKVDVDNKQTYSRNNIFLRK
jgi:hypothetical protein